MPPGIITRACRRAGLLVRTEHVPEIDTAYKFDRETTLAILAGFATTAA
jgi:hypothetical protein